MLWRNPDSRANRWGVSLFTPTEIHDGPAPADRKLDANTGIVNKSEIAQSTNMSAKKLAQQKAGPMSPVSEETKADSIGLFNLKGTVKTTLEMLRRIQRQTAKALSLWELPRSPEWALRVSCSLPSPFQQSTRKASRRNQCTGRRPFPRPPRLSFTCRDTVSPEVWT